MKQIQDSKEAGVGKTYVSKPISNQTQLAEALKASIEAIMPTPLHSNAVYDIGLMLEAAMQDAGYKLQLHQRAFVGTAILAVKE